MLNDYMLSELKEVIEDDASLLEVLSGLKEYKITLPEMVKINLIGYSKSLWVKESHLLGTIEMVLN